MDSANSLRDSYRRSPAPDCLKRSTFLPFCCWDRGPPKKGVPLEHDEVPHEAPTQEEIDKPINWYHYLSKDGLPESINVLSGEVRRKHLLTSELADYVVIKSSEGKLTWVHKDSTAKSAEIKFVPYSTLLASKFCYVLAEGAKVKEACMHTGITYGIFSTWRRLHPEFSDMVEQAMKDRALLLFERLLDVAEETGADSEEVALGKLKVDVYKSMAAVGDEKFSPKTKLSVDARVGIVSIESGIRRPGDPGFEEKAIFKEIDRRQLGKSQEKVLEEPRIVSPMPEISLVNEPAIVPVLVKKDEL